MLKDEIEKILNEFEKNLMDTYLNDGCVSSAITLIQKNHALVRILELVKKCVPEEMKAEIMIEGDKSKYCVGTTYNPYAWTDKSLPYRKGYNDAIAEIKRRIG